MNDNTLIFANEPEEEDSQIPKKKWKVLLADDEKEIHTVTKLVLDNLKFEGHEIEFLSTYTGKETIEVVRDNPDIAVLLLDVVMEKENSGLEVVKAIREELKNTSIRIILRTGQPGQAPEREVIRDYDINDYKEKTELTTKKLYTTIISALRAWRDIDIIEKSKEGLKKVITASVNLFIPKALNDFIEGVVTQLSSLLHMDDGIFCAYMPPSFLAVHKDGFIILGGAGKYSDFENMDAETVVDKNVLHKMESALENKQTVFYKEEYIGYFKSENNTEYILYLDGGKHLTTEDKELLSLFTANVSKAFDTLKLIIEQNKTEEDLLKAKQSAEKANAELTEQLKLLKEEIKILKSKR